VEVVGVARAVWSGALSFGLVNVPVGLFAATQDQTIHFHQFQKDTTDRSRNQRVNERTGREVDFGDIVKGYEVSDGHYVMVTPEELEQVEPGRSRTIEITDFVAAAEIDPLFYEHSYYLAPDGETASKPYGLLLAAMEKAERIGIATFVMRGKQYLAAVRPADRVLVLETMFFADEVRDPAEELETVPKRAAGKGRDLEMAVSLIEALTTGWDPSNYSDTYRDRVLQLIDAKKAGQLIETEEPEPEAAASVTDLMEVLRRSVEKARQRRRPGNAHQATRLGTRAADQQPNHRSAGNTGKDDPVPLEGKTKQELYELAQRLDVAGRSSMTRQQLAAAIDDAQTKPKAS